MKTIFVLDNDSTQQDMMSKHLKAMGFEVRSVVSAAEFDSLNEKAFMVILDEKVENRDGSMQFLKKVAHRMSRVPVVYLMSRPERKSIADAKKLGAFEVIEKNSAALVNLRTILDKLKSEPQRSGWLSKIFGKKENLPALSV